MTNFLINRCFFIAHYLNQLGNSFMANTKKTLLGAIGFLVFSTVVAAAETHTIKARGPAYEPLVVFAEPGDTIAWVNMAMGTHDAKSIPDLIPEGAEHWKSPLGEDFQVTLEKEGIYLYECTPHVGLGMAGAIVVGDPKNLPELEEKIKTAHGAVKRVFRKTKQAIESKQQ
jgi:pseudoazurin